MGRTGDGRTLKTARAVLRVLRHMAQHPEGLTTGDVAALLGKSQATAGYLLNSLCAERFAWHDSAAARYRLLSPASHVAVPTGADDVTSLLPGAAEELYRRTGERSYLARRDGERLVVTDSYGRQGLPKVPGLPETLCAERHAVAIGKVLLAFQPPEASAPVERLRGYTRATITRPAALTRELDRVRAAGYALDREEFAAGFCCLAAPVLDESGRAVAALGVSVPAARFSLTGAALVRQVVRVARDLSAPRAAVS